MGLLDLLKSDQTKFEEKQEEFKLLEEDFNYADSIYNELKSKSPWLVTPQIESTMKAMRIDMEENKQYMERQAAWIATPGAAKPGLLDIPKPSMPSQQTMIEQIPGVGPIIGAGRELGEKFPSVKEAIKKSVLEPGSELVGAVYSRAAGFTNMLDNWTEKISESLGVDQPAVYKALTAEYTRLAQEFSAQGIDPDDAMGEFQKYMYQGIGGFIFDLPVIMGMGLPVFGAAYGGSEVIDYNKELESAKIVLEDWEQYELETVVQALEVSQLDPKSVLWGTFAGGIHGLLLHGILKGAQMLPTPERSLTGMGVFGVPTAVREMSKKPGDRDYPLIVSDMLMGWALLLPGGRAMSRRQLRENLKLQLGEDFAPLVNKFKDLAEDRQLNAYAKQRGEVIARLKQTKEGDKFVRFMRPFETFEEARWRYMHEKINERGAEYEKRTALEQGRKIAEEDAQTEAMEFKRRILGRRINQRFERQQEALRTSQELEKEISDREKRTAYEKIYLEQLSKEDARMQQIDDMNIELMRKESEFMTSMEEILKRYSDVEKKPSEGAPAIIEGAEPPRISKTIEGEKPTTEVLEEQVIADARAKELKEIMDRAIGEKKRYEGAPPIVGEGGPVAGKIRSDKKVDKEAPSGVQRKRGKEPRGEDLQRIEEARRAKPTPQKTELVEEALKVTEESKGKQADESLTGRAYQMGVKARTDSELAKKIERGIEEISDYIKTAEGEDAITASQAKNYFVEAKQAAETTGGFKHAVEKGEVDVTTGQIIPKAERKPKEPITQKEIDEATAFPAYPSDKWTEADPGAIPGEPYFKLASDKSIGITEVEKGKPNSRWAVIFGEDKYKEFDTIGEAAKWGEENATQLKPEIPEPIDVQFLRATKKGAEKPGKEPENIRQVVKGMGKLSGLEKYGISIKEDRNLYMQIGNKKGIPIDDAAKTLIKSEDNPEGVLPPTPSNMNPTDWLIENLRKNTKVGEEFITEAKVDKAFIKHQYKELDVSTIDLKTFTELMEANKEPQNVATADLKKGDKFTIAGEEFKVTKDTGDRMRIEDGQEYELDREFDFITIDKGSLVKAGEKEAKKPGFLKDPFEKPLIPDKETSVAEKVKVGDIVTTNYGTGPYRVEKVVEYKDRELYNAADPSEPIKYEHPTTSLVLSRLDAKRTKSGELHKNYDYSYINELIVKDGKIVDARGGDEVVVEKPKLPEADNLSYAAEYLLADMKKAKKTAPIYTADTLQKNKLIPYDQLEEAGLIKRVGYDKETGFQTYELVEPTKKPVDKTLQEKAEKEFIEEKAKKGEIVTEPGEQARREAREKRVEEGEEDLFTTAEKKKQSDLFGSPSEMVTKYDMPILSKLKKDFGPKDLEDPIRVRDIGKKLAEEINYEVGKDVRMGFIKKWSRKAKGLFFGDTGIIRINNINDLGTFSHEIGHLLDKHIFGIEQRLKPDPEFKHITMAFGIKDAKGREARLNRFKDKYGADLVDSLQERYELRQEMKRLLSVLKYPTKKIDEAIAEFVHQYVIFPEIVEKTTPKFLELFEGIMDTQPQFRKGLLRARDKFKEYREQDPRAIVESTIHRDSEENRLLTAIKSTKDGFFVNVIDGTQPFRQLSNELRKRNPNITGDKDPLLQVLSLIGIEGKATQFFHNHPFLRRGNEIKILKNIRPLFGTRKKAGIIYDIIEEGILNEFEGSVVAKRNLELLKRGLDEAATTTKEISELAIKGHDKTYGKEKLEKLRQELWDYQASVLQYYYESGKMSKENFEKALELNKFFVPFQRFFDVYEGGSSPNYNLGQYVKDYSPKAVHKIKGSHREVVSPIGSIIKNTYDLITAADRNTTLGVIVESLQAVDRRLVQEIPAKQFRPVRVLPKPAEPFIDEEGNQWMSLNEPSKELENRMAVEYKKPRNTEIITVFKDGMPRYYQIPKRYYDSYFSTQETLSRAIRILSLPSRILRAGAVIYDPTFAIRNVARDQVSAWFYTRYGYAPWDFFKGVMGAINKTDSYQKFLASGADQAFLTAIDKEMSKGYIERRAGKKVQTKWQEYKRNPLIFAQDMNRASELGTRVGAFNNAYKKTGDVYMAMYEAREISGDYGVKGLAMKSIAPLYTFLNARIQHAKLIPQSMIRRRPSKFIARALPVVSISIANWYWNHRDDQVREAYSELPLWRRIGAWNVNIPGTDSFISLPRGPLGILFGATTEKFLDHLEKEDPVTLTELGSELAEDYMPIYIGPDLPRLATEITPQFGRPIVEQAMNKIGYTGRTIIPGKYKKLEPEDQYDIYTNEIIKQIGQATGLSPMRIQHLITAYTAGAGRGALAITDEVLEISGITDKSPDDLFTRLSRLPVTRAFVTEAAIGTRGRSVQNFYKKLDQLESLNATKNEYIKDDNLVRMQQLLDGKQGEDLSWYLDNQKAIGRFREVLRIGRFLKTEIAQMRAVDDRRGMIRTIDKALTNIAISFNNAYAEGESFPITKIMSEIYAFGKRAKREEAGIRRQFSGEIKSSDQLRDAMNKLNLYKLRERTGTLKQIDYYRMKALDAKLKRFNKQQIKE